MGLMTSILTFKRYAFMIKLTKVDSQDNDPEVCTSDSDANAWNVPCDSTSLPYKFDLDEQSTGTVTLPFDFIIRDIDAVS